MIDIDLVVPEGNDVLYNISITDNGVAANMTGFTPTVVVRDRSSSYPGTTTYAIGSGLTWVSQSSGTLTLLLAHSATTASQPKMWRLDVTDGSGNVSTVMSGDLIITAV